ncbi:MAG: UDP-glucose 4-epimerase GalE, partial [Pseudomonadota bacterium]|nr:UDP-glucose 4-epimerase GalE [Pseudomonadota bacterium]
AILRGGGIATIMHFAGSIVVPESTKDPLGYYLNNTVKSRTLIEAAVRHGVGSFVFSSTAAVYGIPSEVPIPETALLQPINPYGWSKLMTEQMLRDTDTAHGLRFVALRYFNVAGADPLGRTGQCSKVSTHLIKIAAEYLTGRRDRVEIFGTDYDTPDGTAVRDYIDVGDLADAHVHALRHLLDGKGSMIANCGYGHGYSVREVLEVASKVAGRKIHIIEAPRRAGDPPALIAKCDRVRSELGWRPTRDNLDTIIENALMWEESLSNGSHDQGKSSSAAVPQVQAGARLT